MDDAEHAYDCDVLVIGSGVSGYCAAIQAGRCGCQSILLEKDEVLGGNSGPNLGVGITGADRYNPFGTETGIIHELQEDAAWADAFTHITLGTMPYNISRRNEAAVQEHLEAAGVRVLKRHYARKPVMDSSRIAGVIAEDLAAFRTVRINVRHVVIEASGDGEIGALAGADFDVGTESQEEFGERSAPPIRTKLVQGTSLVAIAHRTDREVVFQAPAGTPPYVPRVWQGQIGSFIHHHGGMFSDRKDLVFLYVTETGGYKDTIRDDGEIYEALLKQLWAEWDHIKNGPHRDEAKCWDLLWVSPKDGKRESRRFLGDYVLTQTDLEEGRLFPDDVAYGGHDLDDHIPFRDGGNIFAYSVPPMYGIPYRCCYSRNIRNLLLAGRLISATHLAHSSSRLMRTGGAIGQAVGMAAALCCEYGCAPSDIARSRVSELQNRLLLADATILGRPVPLEADLAREAAVKTSSEVRFNDQEPGLLVPLLASAGNVLWDWPKELTSLELFLHNDTDVSQPLTVKVFRASRERKWKTFDEYHAWGRNDLRDGAFRELGTVQALLPARHDGWFAMAFANPVRIGEKDACCDDDRVLIALDGNPDVSWAVADRPCEIAEMVEHSHGEAVWKRLRVTGTMRLHPAPMLGEAANVVDGFHRRFSTGPTHFWMSDPLNALPQEIILSWTGLRQFDQVVLTFDNLARARHEYPWESGKRVLNACVKSYAVDILENGSWKEVVREDNNHHRFRIHKTRRLSTEKLRLRVLSAHGEGQAAKVYQIRVHDVGL